MNILELLIKNPWSCFWLLCTVGLTTSFLGDLWKRYMRYRMVKVAGWAPEHLDCDGEFAEAPEVENDKKN
jgi:hypothetical protein